jgi:hypothetical protein
MKMSISRNALNKLSTIILAAVVTCGLSAVMAVAEEASPKTCSQAKCPVMGGDVAKDVYIDHGDKRVYFCCAGCIEKFKADPDGYIKKMEQSGVKFEATPAAGQPATAGEAAQGMPCHAQHAH